MKYNVQLNGKIYEVEVTEKEAILLNVSQASETPVAQPAQPAPVQTEQPPKPAQPAPVAEKAAEKPIQVTQPQPNTGANIVKSPLPGMVREIKVKVGETVKEGQVVAIIEAMKMENEIVASHSGVVTQVFVAANAKVNSGSPLIELV